MDRSHEDGLDQRQFALGEVQVAQTGLKVNFSHRELGATTLIDVTDLPDPSTADPDDPSVQPEIVSQLLTGKLGNPRYEGLFSHNNGVIALITNQLSPDGASRAYIGLSMVDPQDQEAKEITSYILARAGFRTGSFYVPYSFGGADEIGSYFEKLMAQVTQNDQKGKTNPEAQQLLPRSEVTSFIAEHLRASGFPEPNITDQTEVPLAYVAGLIHQVGSKMAPAILQEIYEHLKKANSEREHAGYVDDLALRRRYDLNMAGQRPTASMTMFFGPKEENPDALYKRPQAVFFFHKDTQTGKLVYAGAQVGVRGRLTGTQYMINLLKQQGQVGEHLLTPVKVKDVADQLGGYFASINDQSVAVPENPSTP